MKPHPIAKEFLAGDLRAVMSRAVGTLAFLRRCLSPDGR